MKDTLLTGRKFVISGMTIEVIAENGEQLETQNLTTHETIMMKKSVLLHAIRLGKAEELFDTSAQ